MAAKIIRTAIVGARGYTGNELARLLLRHPEVNLVAAFATQNFSLTDSLLVQSASAVPCYQMEEIQADMADVWFLATPPEVSMQLAPGLIKAGKRVIDLSGAFRLKKTDYRQWYGFDHCEPELLSTALYGLVPFASPLVGDLIANPGCYATAILMALIPLLKHGCIESDALVIDAKSGTTGAGRKVREDLLFSEVSADLAPYKIGRHPHLPEIQEAVQHFAGIDIAPHFTTHLLPVQRGIQAAIYARSKTRDASDIANAFALEFRDQPLVRLQSGPGPLFRLKNVVGTAYTHIAFELVGDQLYVFSMIDNLLKGAASQAIENMNRMLDLPQATGLQEGGLS